MRPLLLIDPNTKATTAEMVRIARNAAPSGVTVEGATPQVGQSSTGFSSGDRGGRNIRVNCPAPSVSESHAIRPDRG